MDYVFTDKRFETKLPTYCLSKLWFVYLRQSKFSVLACLCSAHVHTVIHFLSEWHQSFMKGTLDLILSVSSTVLVFFAEQVTQIQNVIGFGLGDLGCQYWP
jgi:hypothetical protein